MSENRTILVIEKDNEIREFLKLVLKMEGFTVVPVDTGGDAIEYVSSGANIDLVILEARLRDMPGTEVCRFITSYYTNRFVPVLVIAASIDASLIIGMMRSGASDYLVKPFTIQELAESIQINLEKVRGREFWRSPNREDNSVTAQFNFPEAVKVSCEQYLLYFVEFLKDIGIDATASLSEDAGQVLFSVTPKDKDKALDNIREALELYLQLPMNRDATVVITADTSIEVMKLNSQIGYFQGQLQIALTQIQQRDFALQQKDFIIQQQQGLVEDQRMIIQHQRDIISSGQVLIQSLQKEDDTEPLAGGLIKVKPLSVDVVPVEFNTPEFVRIIKRMFGIK